MITHSNPRVVSALRISSRLISLIVALGGIIVLTGWLLDKQALKGIHPYFVTMKSNTALCFLLIGIALCLLNKTPEQLANRVYQYRLAQLCASLVVLIGLLSLSQYVFGWDLGIDQLLFKEAPGAVGTSHPNRMAPNTALNFFLIGLALLALDVETRRGYRPAQFLILIEGIISLLALLGYLYGYSAFYGLPALTKMAVHTAVLFNLIFIGVLSARPDRGMFAVIAGDSLGGMLARRLLPVVIIVSISLGGVLVWSEHQGFYTEGLKNLFFVTITIPLFSGLILVLARFLHQADIERKRLEDKTNQLNDSLNSRNTELEVLNKELDGFSYSVSHDLRVPLRAIDGFSLMLMEDCHDKLDAEGKRLLNVVRDNTKKMSQLIDDLLAFSRLGRKEIALSETDMEAVSRSVYERIKPTVTNRTIQLEIKQLPVAYADPSMMHQVWVNLLINAVKFTRGKSPAVIRIDAKKEADETIYYVRDNGAGFDMQYSGKLFGVFQRLHAQDEFEGTGVGLALVQRIIHKHGGRIWAEGKVNEGATFYFTIPNK